jgi:hypothetical protein
MAIGFFISPKLSSHTMAPEFDSTCNRNYNTEIFLVVKGGWLVWLTTSLP